MSVGSWIYRNVKTFVLEIISFWHTVESFRLLSQLMIRDLRLFYLRVDLVSVKLQ